MADALTDLGGTAVAKDGNVFCVTRRDGSIPVAEQHPLGIYMDDCRHLAGHEIRLAGVAPRLLVTAEGAGPCVVHELTNPPLTLPDGAALPLQTVRLRLERRLDASGSVEERIAVHSYARTPVRLALDVTLTADFAPMLGVRGIIAMPDPAAGSIERLPGGLRFAMRGRDGVDRSTTVTATPAPALTQSEGTMRFDLDLAPACDEEVVLRYELRQGGAPHRPAEPARFSRVTTDDALIQRVLDRSLDDLASLRSRLGGHHYFSAGVPWYATLFGRDSLITAIQMVAWAPEAAEETLRLLAREIGTRSDDVHEEDPGKILHELRLGEAAAPGVTPLARYYGTVDATPLWLCLLCEHADWTGDLTLFRELRPEIDAMLAWIDGPGDRDGDGLLDYAARAPRGLRNQGWKDSDEGVCFEDGTPLEPPVALVEAAAYVARAKRALARLFELDGDGGRAGRLRDEVGELSERIERFWLPDRGHYAMAIDGDGRPTPALASNQGHLLWAMAVGDERAAAVRDALMGERMFSGWGIRTLASGQQAYNPVGYHLGTVWPHDSAMIAFGLRKYGFDEDFTAIFEGLLDAAANAEEYRLPELFAGFSRDEFATPVPYPVACRPQAWAAGAIPYLLKAGLGLSADALDGRLRIRRPSLPRWIDRVEVAGLRVGGSTVDLLFERAGKGHVTLADARVDGDLEVVLEVSGHRRRARESERALSRSLSSE